MAVATFTYLCANVMRSIVIPVSPPPPAVFRARRKKDGVIVALKKIACAGIEDANRALQVGHYGFMVIKTVYILVNVQEGKMLLELHHDGICEHHDFFLYGASLWFRL